MRKLIFDRRVLLGAITCVMLAVVFHASILRIIAYPLSRSDEVAPARYVLFLRSARGSAPAFPFVKEFLATRHERRVLVMRDYVRRAESIGAEPSFLAATIEMLVEQGVPRGQIEVIGDGNVMTSTEMLRYAAEWLSKQDPAAEMLVISQRFNSGYLMDVSRDAVPKALRPRMHILGFARYGVDERTWWHNMVGLKSLLRDYLRLVHLWIFGERRPKIDWDPDAYEQQLRLGANNA